MSTEVDVCPNCGESITLDDEREVRGRAIYECDGCGSKRATDDVVLTLDG